MELVCILFVHLSSISHENFKDRAWIIPELLRLIKLHTYKFGLVYDHMKMWMTLQMDVYYQKKEGKVNFSHI